MLPGRRSISRLRPPRICEKLQHKGWHVTGAMARSCDVRETHRQPRTAPVRDASRQKHTASTVRLFALEGLPTHPTWRSRGAGAAATRYQVHMRLFQMDPSGSWRRAIRRACHSSSTSEIRKLKSRLSTRVTVSPSHLAQDFQSLMPCGRCRLEPFSPEIFLLGCQPLRQQPRFIGDAEFDT